MTVVKVAVNKQFRRSKLGLKFSRQDESLPLTISKISEGGLFEETPLIEGLVVLKINDEDVTWMSPKKAGSILRQTKKGRVTVTAEGFVGKIVRESRGEKLGIILHKPTESSDDIFIWRIKEQSKFYGTDLKPGMKIITINGYKCPSSPTEAIRLMQRTIGKLKIVAVEVDRPKPHGTSSSRIRVEVNSQVSKGSSYDETSPETGDFRETVSIIPSSITSVSGASTSSSKSSIHRRVTAFFKPLMKDERSVETEAMTDSSIESAEKHSYRKRRKRSRKTEMKMMKPQEDINFVSHGDIPDAEDQQSEQDHISTLPSDDYIPHVEGEPYEETISSTKHVIHYMSDRITICAEPDAPEEKCLEDLTLVKVVSIATEEESQRSSSFSKGNVQKSLSIVDDTATLFGEDISLPADFTVDDDHPSDEDSRAANHIASTSNQATPPKNPSPKTTTKVLPPRYPKLMLGLQKRAERTQASTVHDTLEAPLLSLKHEHGIVQDIGTQQESQAIRNSNDEDEIIESIEGDSFELDGDARPNFPPDPPLGLKKLEPVPSTSPRHQKSARRGIDPSEIDHNIDAEWSPRSDVKQLEPPGSRAAIVEPRSRKGIDPEVTLSSAEFRDNTSVRQEIPQTISLQKPPTRRPVPPRVHIQDQDRVHPQVSPRAHPHVSPRCHQRVPSSTEAGCNFIPQEIWDEMYSDLNSFWGRQKDHVESSWASLVGVI